MAQTSATRSRRISIVACAAGLLVALGLTLWPLRGLYPLMRIRNSLVADIGRPADFEWAGDSYPPGFTNERQVPQEFRRIANELLGPDESRGSAFDDALAIAQRLAIDPGHGRRIQGTTADAYRGITAEGRGNCSDVSQAFTGLTVAADLPVREWGMYLDGFNGWGHAFNEVYDEQREQWVLVDAHYSIFFTDRATGRPLSVLELQERLLAGEGLERIAVVPINPARLAKATHRDESELIEYYRWGMAQLGLWFGNGVFSYDQHPLVRATDSLPRSIEQGAAILAGIHPRLKIVATEDNQAAIDTMYRSRNVFFGGLLLSGVLAVALLLQLRAWWRTTRGTTADTLAPPRLKESG